VEEGHGGGKVGRVKEKAARKKDVEEDEDRGGKGKKRERCREPKDGTCVQRCKEPPWCPIPNKRDKESP